MFNKAFTLVELLVVMFILVLIFAAVFGMMLVGRQSFFIGTTSIELQDKVRLSMDKMVREMSASSSARAFVRTQENSTEILEGTTISGNLVSFQVPVALGLDGTIYDVNGTILWGADSRSDWSINYFVSDNKLIRRVIDFNYITGEAPENPPIPPPQQWERWWLRWWKYLPGINDSPVRAFANPDYNDTILAYDIKAINFTGYNQYGNQISSNPTSVLIELTGEKSTLLGPTLGFNVTSKITFRN